MALWRLVEAGSEYREAGVTKKIVEIRKNLFHCFFVVATVQNPYFDYSPSSTWRQGLGLAGAGA